MPLVSCMSPITNKLAAFKRRSAVERERRGSEVPRAAIRRNMDDWGRSKDSDGGAETITDMRPGQGEGEEGATCFRFGRFNVDVAVMHTLCFVGKNDACNENEIWEEATSIDSKRTARGSRSHDPCFPCRLIKAHGLLSLSYTP